MEEQILQRNKKSGAAAGSPNIILPGKNSAVFQTLREFFKEQLGDSVF